MNPVDVVALFGAGVASFLAPCVLPLVPAYVGMMAGEVADDKRSLPRGAVFFVAGFSAVFVLLGVLAGQIGSSLASVVTSTQRVGGVLIAVFGVLMLAAHRGRGPRGFRALEGVRLPTGRTARPLVMGLAFGAAWTPCVGPLLGSALVVAANSRAPFDGAVLLGAYSLGIGTPFVAIALATASSTRVPVLIKQWSRRIAPVAALVLIGFGVLLASGLYERFVGELNIVAAG